jgi:hypothetical protein
MNMVEVKSFETLLAQTKKFLQEHIVRMGDLCSNLKDLTVLRNETIKEKELIKPFNIILAASDLYYRENYHSDILRYILDRKEYMDIFIDYLILISESRSESRIEKENYRNPIVSREKDRIDILVKDEGTKHCIIIENKINNAGDTFRQLPTYYRSQKDSEYTVDRIIYLSIDGRKKPDPKTWEEEDYKLLDSLITYCAALNDTDNDLVNGFLNKCILNSKYIDENAFFRQYIDLLLYWRRDRMDYQLMGKFYEQMKIAENYSTALSISTMLAELLVFRRDRIRDRFINNHKPFFRMGGSTYATTFEGIPEITQEPIRIEVALQQKKTLLNFWAQNQNLVEVVLNTTNLMNDFSKGENNIYMKEFLFPEQEKELDNYITKMLSAMTENIGKIKETINTKNGT